MKKIKSFLLVLCLALMAMTTQAQATRKNFDPTIDMTIGCLCPDGSVGKVQENGCLCGTQLITDYHADSTVKATQTAHPALMTDFQLGYQIGLGLFILGVILYGVFSAKILQ